VVVARMTNIAIALYNFFSGFGLPAYVEYAPPDDAELPYITYQLTDPDWRDSATFYARVWYRSTSYAQINAKVDEIAAAIGEGLRIPTPGGGSIWLNKGTPWSQNISNPGDDTLKEVYLNFILNAFTT
jgi:hypothetical protein